jgi:hypothetical protein
MIGCGKMIERSIENEQASLVEHSFEAINRLLDECEAELLALAATHRLTNTRFTRWRWDQPDITMSWFTGRHKLLGRNIRIAVGVEEQTHELKGVVESNIWLDRELPNSGLFRHWDHFTADPFLIHIQSEVSPAEKSWIRRRIEDVYQPIASSNGFQFRNAVVIERDGGSYPTAPDTNFEIVEESA